jgi:uncharacterized protein YdhG (YjbR/CyaY superfamily)
VAVASIDEYLEGVPTPARELIERIRTIIHEQDPAVVESIAYGMPTFASSGHHRFHLGAWAQHLGVYPVQRAPQPLESALAPLRAAKDTVRLPLDLPLDEELVRQLVAFLLQRPAGS